MMEELKQAIAEYDEAMDVAFTEWHRARAGEVLAEDIKNILEKRLNLADKQVK